MRAQYGLGQARLVKLTRMATGVDCLLVKQCLRLAFSHAAGVSECSVAN